MARKGKRYLVTAIFDIKTLSMESAKIIADILLRETEKPYVRVKDRDSGLTYEHFADGKWKKVV